MCGVSFCKSRLLPQQRRFFLFQNLKILDQTTKILIRRLNFLSLSATKSAIYHLFSEHYSLIYGLATKKMMRVYGGINSQEPALSFFLLKPVLYLIGLFSFTEPLQKAYKA